MCGVLERDGLGVFYFRGYLEASATDIFGARHAYKPSQ